MWPRIAVVVLHLVLKCKKTGNTCNMNAYFSQRWRRLDYIHIAYQNLLGAL